MCGKHAQRYYQHGDPHITKYVRGGIEDRLGGRIVPGDGPDACHLWTRRDGSAPNYGYMWVDGKYRIVNRVIMEMLLSRPLAPEEWVLHTCDNPPCCNPNHLYIGDAADNAQDRKDRKRHWRDRRPPKTHCKRGHEYTEENTYMTRTGRSCLTCRRATTRKWDQENRRKRRAKVA